MTWVGSNISILEWHTLLMAALFYLYHTIKGRQWKSHLYPSQLWTSSPSECLYNSFCNKTNPQSIIWKLISEWNACLFLQPLIWPNLKAFESFSDDGNRYEKSDNQKKIERKLTIRFLRFSKNYLVKFQRYLQIFM